MNKKILGLTLVSVLFAFGGVAQAVTIMPVKPIKVIDPGVIKSVKEQRCEKIKEKIANRNEFFEKNKERQLNAYNNLSDRLNKFAEKLKLKGYDVSDLEADLKVLNEKIQKFSADQDAYIGELNGVKDYLCEKTDAESKTKMDELRASLKQVRQDAKDIREYYRNTIKPDLQAIKKQTPVSTE